MNTFPPCSIQQPLMLIKAGLSSPMVALETQQVWSNPWTVYRDSKMRNTSSRDKSCFMMYKESLSLKVQLKWRWRLCSSTATFIQAPESILLTYTFNLYNLPRVSSKFHHSYFTGGNTEAERWSERRSHGQKNSQY